MLVPAWFGMVTTVGLGNSKESFRQYALRPPFKNHALPIDSFCTPTGRDRQFPPGGTIARYLSFSSLKFMHSVSVSTNPGPMASRRVRNGGRPSSGRLLWRGGGNRARRL